MKQNKTTALGDMEVAVTNPTWSLRSKLHGSKSAGTLILIRTLGVLVLTIALFTACTDKDDDDGNGNDPTCDCTVKVHPFGTPCSCGLKDCDCVEDIQREFPITSGAYTVIIKDGRTSESTETLEDLGVITKFEALLTHAGITGNSAYINIVPRGLMIILESGVEYANYKAIDGNTIGANLEWVLETSIANTGSRGIFTHTLGTMDALTFTQR